ncbi:hypothetical protein J6590_047805 [Homalodisca vitripennis]|nr:hypothetical protein J6590_047805 [Homalodisca vitripennis]
MLCAGFTIVLKATSPHASEGVSDQSLTSSVTLVASADNLFGVWRERARDAVGRPFASARHTWDWEKGRELAGMATIDGQTFIEMRLMAEDSLFKRGKTRRMGEGRGWLSAGNQYREAPSCRFGPLSPAHLLLEPAIVAMLSYSRGIRTTGTVHL